MLYIRISLMMPEKGKREEVRRLNQEISAFNRGLEGCRDSFVISAADNSGELGRLSVWDSKEAAEGAYIIGEGLLGGRYKGIVDCLELKGARGTMYDHIRLKGIKLERP